MVLDQDTSATDVDRRSVLKTVGAAGVVSIAGCLGGDDSSDADFPMELELEVNAGADDRVQMVELISESLDQTDYFETSIETFEWNNYTARVMGPDYPEMGKLPTIGLSGTFNPGSFCNALNHTDNIGQCCNLTGVGNDELDQMIDDARYGLEVSQDNELRGEQYDEVWSELADLKYSSITHFDVNSGVTTTDVHNFSAWPFSESIVSYAMYGPADEQIMWLDRENAASPDSETPLSELSEGGELNVGVAANVASFDPPYSTDTTATFAQNYIFEALTTSDAEGNSYPWLAESYEALDVQDVDRTAYADYMTTVSADDEGVLDTDEQVIVQHPDDDPVGDDEVRVLTPTEAADAVADGTYGMQYRYNLEQGVQFSNGDEMTAEDVIASLKRYENSQVSAQTFNTILHAEAVDEYTVDIYAQIPDAEAERQLPAFVIMPASLAEVDDGDVDPRNGNDPIGTGPYVLSEFEDANYFTVERNDNYWMDEKGIQNKDWFEGPEGFPNGPVFDTIYNEVITDNSTRQSALQNEELDITYGLNSGQLDGFVESDDFIVGTVDAGGYEYMQYPIAEEPFDDSRFRQAINHLIPRQQIVDNVLNGWGSPAWTCLPTLARGAGTADYDALEEEVKPTNEYDPEQATSLIEEVIDDTDLSSDI